MTTEATLIRAIQVAATEAGARLFRNNTGMGWTGIVTHGRDRLGEYVLIRKPRPLHAGLFVGSSDLIGWAADGQFLAIEVKAGRTRITDAQYVFIAQVLAAGGRGGIARSVEDAMDIIGGNHD